MNGPQPSWRDQLWAPETNVAAPSTFVHGSAIVEPGARIGQGTRVWAFAHVLAGAVIGNDCNICDHTFIENDVSIGDRVTIKCGVQVWDGVSLESDVFVGPNATFTNDLYPRSKRTPREFLRTLVREGASIGANATVSPGITIGRQAMVGAGAVVTHDVPPFAVVTGNPARIQAYVDVVPPVGPAAAVKTNGTTGAPGRDIIESVAPDGGQQFAGGSRLYDLPLILDLRGALSFAELDQPLPFSPRRYFVVFDVPSKEVRGEHAHRRLQQFLVCVRGSCNVVLDDGDTRNEVVLDTPQLGLYVPAMVWTIQYKYSADAMLLVLASDVYQADDYIRDYDEFVRHVRGG